MLLACERQPSTEVYEQPSVYLQAGSSISMWSGAVQFLRVQTWAASRSMIQNYARKSQDMTKRVHVSKHPYSKYLGFKGLDM